MMYKSSLKPSCRQTAQILLQFVPSALQFTDSIAYLFTGPEGVLRTIVRNNSRPYDPLIAINTGGLRFDIFKGDFTVNDQLITMPFDNEFVYVSNVTRSTAEGFLAMLNAGQLSIFLYHSSLAPSNVQCYKVFDGCGNNLVGHRVFHRRSINQSVSIKDQEHHRDLDAENMNPSSVQRQTSSQIHFAPTRENPEPQSYGHVTRDNCSASDKGDDTPHRPLPNMETPIGYIATALPPDAPNVDIVFYRFVHMFSMT